MNTRHQQEDGHLTSLRERLGEMLQQQRQRFGLTQSDLAERAHLSLKYLGEIERGEANVTVDALERIASALEWDPWQLFNTDRTPISKTVHQLLLAEIGNTRQRLSMMLDWLSALDPASRSEVPATLEAAAAQAAAGDGSSFAAADEHAPAIPVPRRRRRALPRRRRPQVPPVDTSSADTHDGRDDDDGGADES